MNKNKANATGSMVTKVSDSAKMLNDGRYTIVARGNASVVVRYYRDANGRKRQQWQVVKS